MSAPIPREEQARINAMPLLHRQPPVPFELAGAPLLRVRAMHAAAWVAFAAAIWFAMWALGTRL